MTRVKKGVNALKTRRNTLRKVKGYRFGRSKKEKKQFFTPALTPLLIDETKKVTSEDCGMLRLAQLWPKKACLTVSLWARSKRRTFLLTAKYWHPSPKINRNISPEYIKK